MNSVLQRHEPARPGERAAASRILIAGVLAFAAVLFAWIGYTVVRGSSATLFPVDLQVYRDGGLIVRHISPPYNHTLQYPLYDWHASDNDTLQFTYTPFAALFFAVVSGIPWQFLPRVSEVANLFFLFAAAWYTMVALGYRDRRVRIGGALLGAAAGLLTEPVFRTMYLGQINLLLMAVLIWDLCQPDSRRWKGVAAGLAAGIKLVPLIFIPYLLLTRRFRAAAMASGAFACAVLLGFIVIPGDSKAFWLHGLFIQDGRTGFVGWGGNQSLRAIATRLAGSINAGTVPWLTAAVLATVFGLIAAAQFHRAGHTMLGLLTTALVGLLDSPISWDHHWVWVMPGLMVGAHYAIRAWRAGKRRSRYGWAFVTAALLLVFLPWPGVLWSRPSTGPGNFVDGIIWAAPNSPVTKYIKFGDQPWFTEYHWAGLQNLAGNAYILAGVALLILLAVAARRAGGGIRAVFRRDQRNLAAGVNALGDGIPSGSVTVRTTERPDPASDGDGVAARSAARLLPE